MINIRNLKIDAEATLGSPLILIKAAPTFAYENGVPTAKRDGTRYTVACPGCDMQAIGIKVPGPQTVETAENAIVAVACDGLELYIYYRDNKPMIGARAKSIRKLEALR